MSRFYLIRLIVCAVLGFTLSSAYSFIFAESSENKPSPPAQICQTIQLLEEVRLEAGQCVQIDQSGYSLKILQFYNSPCPEGAMCVWSGVGMALEHSFQGKTKKGMNLVQAFGYQVTIHETDHEVYALLSINTIAP